MKYRIRPIWFFVPAIFGALVAGLSGNIALGFALFAIMMTPGMLEIYIPYAKDNPRHLWFKRKLYGWGWTPVTWEGWVITLLYVVLLVGFGLTLDEDSPTSEILFTFVLPAVLLTITFIRIAYVRGESPRWQWGEEEK